MLPIFLLFECSAGIPYMTVLNKEGEGGKEGEERKKKQRVFWQSTKPDQWSFEPGGKSCLIPTTKRNGAWVIIQATGICACSLLEHVQIIAAPSLLIPVYAVLKQGVIIILKIA